MPEDSVHVHNFQVRAEKPIPNKDKSKGPVGKIQQGRCSCGAKARRYWWSDKSQPSSWTIQ